MTSYWAERALKSEDVLAWLQKAIQQHGAPEYLRSDNGSEFIAKIVQRWLAENRIKTLYIDPGSPWQNGLNERFNGTLRDECLNMETFASRDQARMICKVYGREYNTLRPHSSLGYLTPLEFAAQWREGRKENAAEKKKDGCAGGEELRLSHCAPPAVLPTKNGSSAEARPDSRKAIHDGAPVARQQSRILRVDAMTLTRNKRAGKVPAQTR